MTDKCPYKNPYVNIITFCVTCTVVYVYLYTNFSYKTQTVTNFMNTAISDIHEWKKKLEKYINIQEQIKEEEQINTSEMKKEESFEIEYNANTTSFLLVLFTTFSDSKEKYTCRNNTLMNWMSLGSNVKPVFFSDDFNLSSRVEEKGWDVYPPSKTAVGVPMLRNMFIDVMKKYPSKFYAYVNGDILFTQGLLKTLHAILNSTKINQTHPLLIIGQRTNVKYVTKEEASTYEGIEKIATRGFLFTPWGEDYFITNSVYPWHDCPEIVVGRIAYDNWLVLNANKRRHTTVDATKTLLAVHQTTASGNQEGHTKKDSHYNTNLLNKLYKKVNFENGMTTCTRKYTVLNSTTFQIQILDRKGC